MVNTAEQLTDDGKLFLYKIADDIEKLRRIDRKFWHHQTDQTNLNIQDKEILHQMISDW